jgi:phosphatidate phosphatase APP1
VKAAAPNTIIVVFIVSCTTKERERERERKCSKRFFRIIYARTRKVDTQKSLYRTQILMIDLHLKKKKSSKKPDHTRPEKHTFTDVIFAT